MGRPLGSKPVKSQRARENTQEFFCRMLTDAAETETWNRFLQSNNEEIALRAFLRAVEYKRGKPIQPTDNYSKQTTLVMGALPVPIAEPPEVVQ
jgi:hypothetical protein